MDRREILKIFWNFILRSFGFEFFAEFNFKFSLLVAILLMNFSVLTSSTLLQVLTSKNKEWISSKATLAEYVFMLIFLVTIIVIFLESFFNERFSREFNEKLREARRIMILKKYQTTLKNGNYCSSLNYIIRCGVVSLRISLIIFLNFFDEAQSIWNFLFYPTMVMIMFSFHYVTTIKYLTRAYESIHEFVTIFHREIYKDDNCKTSKSTLDEIVFDDVISCQNKLNDCLQKLNKRYRLSIFFVISSCFFSITYTSYFFFVELETTQRWTSIIGEIHF